MRFEIAMERVSLLYLVSYASLLSIGALCLALANMALGAILFSLGLVLVVGGEYAIMRRRPPADNAKAAGMSSDLYGMLSFSLVACAASFAAAILLSSFYGWSGRMLVLAFSGLAASAVKLMAATVHLFFAK